MICAAHEGALVPSLGRSMADDIRKSAPARYPADAKDSAVLHLSALTSDHVCFAHAA